MVSSSTGEGWALPEDKSSDPNLFQEEGSVQDSSLVSLVLFSRYHSRILVSAHTRGLTYAWLQLEEPSPTLKPHPVSSPPVSLEAEAKKMGPNIRNLTYLAHNKEEYKSWEETCSVRDLF